jgi:hypothetical protein
VGLSLHPAGAPRTHTGRLPVLPYPHHTGLGSPPTGPLYRSTPPATLRSARVRHLGATGSPKGGPPFENVRDVWTLRYIQTNCTAAIWRNEFGLELRVGHGGELIESRLSRFGEARLLLIIKESRANASSAIVFNGLCRDRSHLTMLVGGIDIDRHECRVLKPT